jgi:hypothetical protein
MECPRSRKRFEEMEEEVSRLKSYYIYHNRQSSVAGSEAAVERTFSAQGKVHTKGRNRLKDESVEAEMFCRFNGAALERKVQEKDTGHWIELTEDYEEVEQAVTAEFLWLEWHRSRRSMKKRRRERRTRGRERRRSGWKRKQRRARR